MTNSYTAHTHAHININIAAKLCRSCISI